MRSPVKNTQLTPAISGAVLKLLNNLHTSDIKASGGSETQKSSMKSEKDVLNILGLPDVPKVKKNKENSTCIPMNPGYYFGFKRTVKKQNKCYIVVPETDGCTA